MIYPLVRELAADGIDVAVACRVLEIPRSSYYDWRERPASLRDLEDAYLIEEIRAIHLASRQTYGAPRVHDELRLGRQRRLGRKRVARLMRLVGLVGIGATKKRRGRPAPAVHDDLVRRRFVAEGPDRLWFTDITEHPTAEGTLGAGTRLVGVWVWFADMFGRPSDPARLCTYDPQSSTSRLVIRAEPYGSAYS